MKEDEDRVLDKKCSGSKSISKAQIVAPLLTIGINFSLTEM